MIGALKFFHGNHDIVPHVPKAPSGWIRSKENDVKKSLSAFKHDLKNGPLHWFGFHQNCSTDFFNQQHSTTPTSSSSSFSTFLFSSENKDDADPDNDDADVGEWIL